MMKNKTLTGPDRVMPHELWLSRTEYQESPLDVFRGHIHKEIKSAKQSNWNEGQKKNEATKQGLYLGIVHFSTLEFSWWVVGYVFWATHKMVRWCCDTRYAIWYLVHLPFGGLPIDMIPSSKFYNMATNIDIELILTQT